MASERTGWRGRRTRAEKTVRHRWQQSAAERPETVALRRGRRRGVWTAVWLAAFAALMGLFLYLVLWTREQTPFIAVAAAPYGVPFEPNAWATEDAAAIDEDLDGQTLDLSDLSASWRSRQRGLTALDAQLDRLAENGSATGAAILSLSMHGAVDGDGEPCLVPPDASPLDSRTWIPIRRLLEMIEEKDLSADLRVLLVLDAGRTPVNWRTGTLYNAFADRLPAVVKAANVPNLVVLNSTGPGQTGWASADLQATVFGHYLRLGLAGAADDDAEGGDDDRWVSLHELVHYLNHHVDEWARHNRGDRQQPMLLPAGARDFRLCWSLNAAARRRIASRTTNRGAASVSETDIAALCADYSRITALNPYRFDPVALRDVERKLVWLEQAATSGEAYTGPAQRAHDELARRLKTILDRAEDLGPAPSLPGRANLFTDRPEDRRESLRMHSLRLAEHLGTLDGETLTSARAALARLDESSEPAAIGEVIATLTQRQELAALQETHLLRMLARHEVGRLWPQSSVPAEAIVMQRLASSAAVPDDERTHYWIRAAIAQADAARRQWEDDLFLGPAAELSVSTASPQQTAERLYAEAQTQADEIAAALAVRDRTWAELPYLAEWLTRPLPEEPLFTDADVDRTLLRLIEANHQLGAVLSSDAVFPDGSDELPDHADALATTIELRDQLRRLYGEECLKLLETTRADAVSLRRIDAALSVPLLSAENATLGLSPAQQRSRLREAEGRFAAQLHGTFLPTPAGPGDRPAANAESDNGVPASLERMTRWSEHPALAILSRRHLDPVAVTPPPEPPGRDLALLVARWGETVRNRLDDVPQQIERYREAPAASPGSVRGRWARGERLLRAAAPLRSRELEVDPIIELRQLDVQQLLVWQARRAIDDYWGPITAQERSFYDLAATDYLAAAETVFRDNPSLRRQQAEMGRLLAERRDAARGGLTTSARNLVMISTSENVSSEVTVRPGPAEARDGFPTGTASVFLRDALGRIDGSTQPLPLPLASAAPIDLSERLPGELLSSRGPELTAVTLYRGHEFTAPLMLSAAGGVTIAYQPHVYDHSTVTVSAFARKRFAIVFILDCSHSMSDPVSAEGPGERMTKLEAAKIALVQMLDELAEQRGARIGATFFGHRVAWNPQSPSLVEKQREYAGPIPDVLKPYEDVEHFKRLGRFDQIVAGQVELRLESIRPWGETPLYLAMTEALGQFDTESAEYDRRLVVITDGANQQRSPTSDKRRSRDDVIRAAQRADVPVHLVGFGIPRGEAQQTGQEFRTIAEETDGSFVTASEATSLIDTLHALLAPTVYTVRPELGEAIEERVREAVVISPPRAEPQQYTVTVESLSTGFELRGGEALEFSPDRAETRLVVGRYEPGTPIFVPLAGAPSGHVVGIHRPVSYRDGVEFEFSVQHEAREFVARPEEVWIEITPVVADAPLPPPKYVFYHTNYEPRTTVPVLKCRADGWPTDAGRARIRFWCRPTRTETADVLRLRDAVEATTREGHAPPVPGLPDLEWQVRTKSGEFFQLEVVEHYAADTPEIDLLKIEPQNVVTPVRVVHTYDERNKLVMHTFYYLPSDAPRVAAGTLRLTLRRALQEAAWQFTDAVTIDVVNSSDLLLVPPAPTEP